MSNPELEMSYRLIMTRVLVTIQLLSQDINNDTFIIYNDEYLCH